MKKVLFISRGNGGVNYHRILVPFLYLKKNNKDYEYYYDNNVDYSNDNNLNKLFEYDFIVYNKTILPKVEDNEKLISELKNKNIKIFCDIDDYWVLDKTHALHLHTNLINDVKLVESNIINADLVTTTNKYLLSKIKRLNNNVYILENGFDENIGQYKSSWKPSSKVRISYIGSSTHENDIKLLDGTVNLLLSDNEIKDKFIIQNCGFNVKGTKLKRDINPDFFKVINLLGLKENEILKQLIEVNFDLNKIKTLPLNVKEMFKDKLVKYVVVDIEPKESPYYIYEKILSDNFRGLSKQYINFLHEFKNEFYQNSEHVSYIRKWSKDVLNYMEFYDETDVVIAPLLTNEYNKSKSNLKMVEALTRKLPIVCSNIQPYSEHGINNTNCILIDDSKKNSYRDWYKALKKLILNEDERIRLGQNLYDDLSDKFSLKNITEKRLNLFNKYEE